MSLFITNPLFDIDFYFSVVAYQFPQELFRSSLYLYGGSSRNVWCGSSDTLVQTRTSGMWNHLGDYYNISRLRIQRPRSLALMQGRHTHNPLRLWRLRN